MQRSISFLWGLVIFLLILNLALLYGLNLARRMAIETLDQVETKLDQLASEVIVYNVEINQAVPIRADVPLNQTMQIPLNTVIPIDQELRMPVQTLAGEITVAVPVKVDFPVEMVVPVEVNETINLDTVVQLNTTVPVEIDVAKTQLSDYLGQTKQYLVRLRNRLALGGEIVTGQEFVSSAGSAVGAHIPDEPAGGSGLQRIANPIDEGQNTRSESDSIQELGVSDAAPAVSAEASSGQDGDQADLGWCTHSYWPLQPGSTWTYNSPVTSFTLRVDDASDNRVYLSTQYEGQDIQFNVGCQQNGLGGDYLGDMRRITELGNLTFSDFRGLFLPGVDTLEEIGASWSQEFEIGGTVQAKQGDASVYGTVTRGRGTAVYTGVALETVETPFGPREALRIDQKLSLELLVDFMLATQNVTATETIELTNSYWFAKGLGPIKSHWYGGNMRQSVMFEQSPVHQQAAIPALTEDQLVFACVLGEKQSLECKRIPSMAQAELTTPPEHELEIPVWVLPDELASNSNASSQSTIDSGEPDSNDSPTRSTPSESDDGRADTPSNPDRPGDDRANLLAYAAAVEDLAEKISQAGQDFGQSAIRYRDGQITIEQFQDSFSEFAPKVERLIQGINALSPPPEAIAIHRELSSGLKKCNQAIDLMDEWFKTGNGSLKGTTVLLVSDCINDVTAAGNKLRELLSQN